MYWPDGGNEKGDQRGDDGGAERGAAITGGW